MKPRDKDVADVEADSGEDQRLPREVSGKESSVEMDPDIVLTRLNNS